MNDMQKLVLFILSLQLCYSIGFAQGVGEPFSDFTMLDRTGEALAFAELMGTPIVFNVWATWCPPCREELPLLQRLSDEANAHEQGLQVILLNNQEAAEDAEAYLVENDIELFSFLDADRTTRERFAEEGIVLNRALEVIRDYRVRGMPATYFIDHEAKVVSVYLGLLSPAILTEHLAGIGVAWP